MWAGRSQSPHHKLRGTRLLLAERAQVLHQAAWQLQRHMAAVQLLRGAPADRCRSLLPLDAFGRTPTSRPKMKWRCSCCTRPPTARTCGSNGSGPPPDSGQRGESVSSWATFPAHPRGGRCCFGMPGVPNERQHRGCPWRCHRCTVAWDRARAQLRPATGNTGCQPATGVAVCGMVSAGAAALAMQATSAPAQRRPIAHQFNRGGDWGCVS